MTVWLVQFSMLSEHVVPCTLHLEMEVSAQADLLQNCASAIDNLRIKKGGEVEIGLVSFCQVHGVHSHKYCSLCATYLGPKLEEKVRE